MTKAATSGNSVMTEETVLPIHQCVDDDRQNVQHV